MIDQTTDNIHRTIPSNIEDTLIGVLGQKVALKAEIRQLEHDQARLLTALGIDPVHEGIEDAIAVAEALVAYLGAAE